MKWLILISIMTSSLMVYYTVIGSSENQEATAYNNGYHLSRQPNTTHLLAAYNWKVTRDDFNPANTQWWLYESEHDGVSWTLTRQNAGCFPSIGMDSYENWGAAFLDSMVHPSGFQPGDAPYVGHRLHIMLKNKLAYGEPESHYDITKALIPPFNIEADSTWFGPPSLSWLEYGTTPDGVIVWYCSRRFSLGVL